MSNGNSGFLDPTQMTFDPTPEALKAMQAMMAQGMMQQMMTGGQNVPGMPNLESIFTQLYGPGAAPTLPGRPVTPPPVSKPPKGGPPRGKPPKEGTPRGRPVDTGKRKKNPNLPPIEGTPIGTIPTMPPLFPRPVMPIIPPPVIPRPGLPTTPPPITVPPPTQRPSIPVPMPEFPRAKDTISPISSGSRSIRSGVGSGFPALIDMLMRR